MSKQFLHGLAIIFVPFERWNEAYKKNRLDHLRRLVLRCRDEDVFFETKRLTKTQANALVRMVDEFFSNKGISKNRDDYVDTMRELYDSLRGQNDDSGAFVDIPLEPKQARQVIWWMGEILKFDRWEAGLDVPLGSDYLSSGYDGGHEWCETCGAILREDVGDCTKRKCPLREEFAEDFLDA